MRNPTAYDNAERLTSPFAAADSPRRRAAAQTQRSFQDGAPAVTVWGELAEPTPLTLATSAESTSAGPFGTESENIVEEARREAAQLVADAQRQSREILASALAESQQARVDAENAGYSYGVNQATLRITADLASAFDQRVSEMRAEVEDTVRSIVDARERMWLGIESEIAALALEIARKVIKIEVTQNADVVTGVVKDALRRVASRDSVRVLVHPSALAQVRDNRADILLAIDNVQHLAIDGDQRVGVGGCVIETNAGSIDAKIDIQLEQVEQALRG